MRMPLTNKIILKSLSFRNFVNLMVQNLLRSTSFRHGTKGCDYCDWCGMLIYQNHYFDVLRYIFYLCFICQFSHGTSFSVFTQFIQEWSIKSLIYSNWAVGQQSKAVTWISPRSSFWESNIEIAVIFKKKSSINIIHFGTCLVLHCSLSTTVG